MYLKEIALRALVRILRNKQIKKKLGAHLDKKMDDKQIELLGRKVDINNKADMDTLYKDKNYRLFNTLRNKVFK